jgi:Family of unknown function (DUF5719)
MNFSRELLMGLSLVGLLFLGVAFDGATDEVKAPEEVASSERIFTERASFCPPSGEDTDGTVHIAASGSGDAPVTAGVEPSEEGAEELGSKALIQDVNDGKAVGVVGYGSRVQASASTTYREPVPGLGAAACSARATTHWYFAQGSVALGFDERLVLYNPFPDEAVVRVTFYTPEGPKTKAGLTDIAIPSGGATTLRMNRFILQESVLGVDIASVRGRFVAWKAVFSNTDNRPSGVSLTLGATEPAADWFFPTGASGRGIEERISVLNPSDDEAMVDITLVTDKKVLNPRKLVGIDLPPGSTKEFSLSEALGDAEVGGLSAHVRSMNGVEVVAERSVFYDTATFVGYASEIGAAAPSKTMWIGPPAGAPTSDTIILLNPSEEEAEVDVELRRASGEPLRPESLQGITVATGGRGRIELSKWSEDEPVIAIVTSTTPLVGERIAYSASTNDVSTLMAIPVP